MTRLKFGWRKTEVNNILIFCRIMELVEIKKACLGLDEFDKSIFILPWIQTIIHPLHERMTEVVHSGDDITIDQRTICLCQVTAMSTIPVSDLCEIAPILRDILLGLMIVQQTHNDSECPDLELAATTLINRCCSIVRYPCANIPRLERLPGILSEVYTRLLY